METIVKKNKFVNEAKCQSIYYNLLVLSTRNIGPKYGFIVELAQTLRCDSYHDFSTLREEYMKYLGDEKYANLFNYGKKVEAIEENKAAEVVDSLAWKTEYRLVKALNWKNKLSYCGLKLEQGSNAVLRKLHIKKD